MGLITLIQDTREQLGYRDLFSVPCVVGTLSVGDYSVVGLEDRVAVERKSLSDLLGTLTRGRERFEKELAKTRSLERFAVVVEARAVTIYDGKFEEISLANARSVWESMAALYVRYNVPFFLSENRRIGAAWVESILTKYAREFLKTADRLRIESKKVASSGNEE